MISTLCLTWSTTELTNRNDRTCSLGRKATHIYQTWFVCYSAGDSDVVLIFLTTLNACLHRLALYLCILGQARSHWNQTPSLCLRSDWWVCLASHMAKVNQHGCWREDKQQNAEPSSHYTTWFIWRDETRGASAANVPSSLNMESSILLNLMYLQHYWKCW